MTRRVYKYRLPVADEFDIDMPVGAQPMTVQDTVRGPCLWALIDPARPSVPHRFYVVGTGNEMPHFATLYIGTWQAGPFVWHLFTEKETP